VSTTTSTATARSRPTPEHLVQFYDSPGQLTERVADFVGGGEDDIAIVVATEPHRRAFTDGLVARGVDVAARQRAGSLIVLDAQATLDRFFDGHRCDPAGYATVIGGLVRQAAARGRPVRIYGEMVAVLWEAGLVNAALELEDLWNDLARTLPFTLLCGYPAEAMQAGSDAISKVCAAHTTVAGRPTQLSPPTVSRTFGRGTSTPSEVRRLVRSTLTGWELDALLDDATLVASELTNNALLHADSDITLTLSLTDSLIRVCVGDSSTAIPCPGAPTARSGSGRGLHIVQTLATSWGWDTVPGGKVVWAELRR
jgi:anti-sigma regulatory factor (Ser/Thr protein kinase)